jgi:response regulator NasT
MTNIIVAFPKPETARSVKRLLIMSGHSVEGLCTTGAQALKYMDELGGGIIVCGYRFSDMMYTELHEYMTPSFEMLLVASRANCDSREVDDLVCLSTPLRANELLTTVEMMENTLIRRKKKMRYMRKERSDEDRSLIREAKELLMERNSLTEDEAHRYLQKRSMDNGTDLTETAQMIIGLMTT